MGWDMMRRRYPLCASWKLSSPIKPVDCCVSEYEQQMGVAING